MSPFDRPKHLMTDYLVLHYILSLPVKHPMLHWMDDRWILLEAEIQPLELSLNAVPGPQRQEDNFAEFVIVLDSSVGFLKN
jgi:hypothetical protein